jgi:hypothetical protein
MLHNVRLQRLSNVKYSNLLFQFVSYEEKRIIVNLVHGVNLTNIL